MKYVALFFLFASAWMMAGCESSTTAPAANAGSQEPVTTCYVQRSGENLSVVQVTVQGDSVSGYIAQEMVVGNGARGSFSGRKEGNLITADYTFLMDSTVQIHEVMFKMEGDKLFQGAGGMIMDNNRMVMRDKSALHWLGPLVKTDCNSVEDAIDRAWQTALSIRKSG
jgi:hypothetical protein